MEKSQYIYILKLRPELLDDDKWTDNDNKLVEEHFIRLQKDTERGIVILAGRTLTNTEEGMGIVIFEAESEEKAQQYMNTDPAVKGGTMFATLFPYRVALMRKNP